MHSMAKTIIEAINQTIADRGKHIMLIDIYLLRVTQKITIVDNSWEQYEMKVEFDVVVN